MGVESSSHDNPFCGGMTIGSQANMAFIGSHQSASGMYGHTRVISSCFAIIALARTLGINTQGGFAQIFGPTQDAAKAPPSVDVE
ncbi:hypothetical protein SARC_15452, partial [Sphaeroforma arctica JP610]